MDSHSHSMNTGEIETSCVVEESSFDEPPERINRCTLKATKCSFKFF